MTLPTVTLAFDARSLAHPHNLDATHVIWRAASTVFAVRCPYDPDRLTERARRLIASGWQGSVYLGDDLADTPLRGRRRSCSILDAVPLLARHFGWSEARTEEARRRAEAWLAVYGEACDAQVDVFEYQLGSAPLKALDDATGYINALAEYPGLVALDDPPIEVGAAPWAWILAGEVAHEPILEAA